MENAIATIKKMHFTGTKWVFIDFEKDISTTTDIVPATPVPEAPDATVVVTEDIPE